MRLDVVCKFHELVYGNGIQAVSCRIHALNLLWFCLFVCFFNLPSLLSLVLITLESFDSDIRTDPFQDSFL